MFQDLGTDYDYAMRIQRERILHYQSITPPDSDGLEEKAGVDTVSRAFLRIYESLDKFRVKPKMPSLSI